MERKEKLIQELEKEAKMLREKHGMSTDDHMFAIEYLKTGNLPLSVNLKDYDILDAAVNDYECLLSDYEA